MTNSEDAINNLYVFKYNNQALSQIIAYNVNVVRTIKDHAKMMNCSTSEIETFASDTITSVKLKQFARIAEQIGYQIYQIKKI